MLHCKSRTVALLAAALAAGSAGIMAAATRTLAQNTVKLELWSRQDPSGPLRPGNVVKAAERLNKELDAEGSGKRVQVVVRESPAFVGQAWQKVHLSRQTLDEQVWEVKAAQVWQVQQRLPCAPIAME